MFLKFYRDPKNGTVLRQIGKPSNIESFSKSTLPWCKVPSDTPYTRELIGDSSAMTLVGITTEEVVAIIEHLKANHH